MRGELPPVLGSARADLVTVEVVVALRRTGVRAILLKGPSVARWLYDGGADRPYVDCDLLVAPQDHARAEDVLRGLGFARVLGDEDTPGWRQAGHGWSRGPAHPEVDLHHTLTGVEATARELWETLTAETETIQLGGIEVDVLSPPARALHVALHAAQHGIRSYQPMRDLERALKGVDPETWREARRVAQNLRALDALGAGLRLTPAGRKLAHDLELPDPRSLETVLLSTSPPAGAVGWHQLVQTRGAAAKTRVIARKIVPTPTFMRHWSPLGRGPLALALAYLWRPFWVVLQLPAGLGAWVRARRALRLGGDISAAVDAQASRPPAPAPHRLSETDP